MLLELGQRAAAVGLADGDESPLPLTQEILADALGLSVVHVNRTLQQLRRDGLLDIRGSSLRLLDPDRLAVIAEYQAPCISSPVRAGTGAISALRRRCADAERRGDCAKLAPELGGNGNAGAGAQDRLAAAAFAGHQQLVELLPGGAGS